MIKAVLFDLDGVLIDTEHISTEAAVRSMREQGIILTAMDKKLITGRNPVDYSVDFAKNHSFNRNRMLERHVFLYDELYYKARPFPYADELIKTLKKMGVKLCIVTSAMMGTLRNALKVLRLDESYFDAFITFDDCKKRKPDPQPYLMAAKRLRVKPSECIVIEDSIPGVAAAKNAKMKCVAVTNSFPASKLKKADLIVKSLNDRRIKGLLC